MVDLHDLKLHPEQNAVIVFADGTTLFGKGVGLKGETFGELCFNTSITGYQEILTDPSYAGQIITFTFPHIGNVGANDQDVESSAIHAKGLVLREDITESSNYRSQEHLNAYLSRNQITGICDVDTRFITAKIRKEGAQNVVIAHIEAGETFNIEALKTKLAAVPSLKGMELAKSVSCSNISEWKEGVWDGEKNTFGLQQQEGAAKVVAIDYGIKRNIARLLVNQGLEVIVVPAETSFDTIMSHNPDGVFLSNGPGDPAATGAYSLPVIKKILETGMPVFGICLGHQMLALALGCKTEKMHQGHRGANHPVQCLESKQVFITSQNHGFVVSKDTIPSNVEVTHLSLFDQTIQGIKIKDKAVFSVQGHPEASPGPHDSECLFKQFAENIYKYKNNETSKVSATA